MPKIAKNFPLCYVRLHTNYSLISKITFINFWWNLSIIILCCCFFIGILIPKQMVPACLVFFFKDPKQYSMKIIMEWFHQKLMEVMLAIRLGTFSFTAINSLISNPKLYIPSMYYKHLKKGAHQSHLGRQKMCWFLYIKYNWNIKQNRNLDFNPEFSR